MDKYQRRITTASTNQILFFESAGCSRETTQPAPGAVNVGLDAGSTPAGSTIQNTTIMTKEDRLSKKRQLYHRLLLLLGEAKYKEVITEGSFGVESTKELTEEQLDSLISNAQLRINERRLNVRPTAVKPENDAEIRRLRNKCLLALAERGIRATTKDWSAINKELEADRYQWVLTDAQRAKGLKNTRGLKAFNNKEVLTKLFKQLCQIRDNEKKHIAEVQELARQN